MIRQKIGRECGQAWRPASRDGSRPCRCSSRIVRARQAGRAAPGLTIGLTKRTRHRARQADSHGKKAPSYMSPTERASGSVHPRSKPGLAGWICARVQEAVIDAAGAAVYRKAADWQANQAHRETDAATTPVVAAEQRAPKRTA